MPELTPQDVGEFRALFLKETGHELTEAQAKEYASALIRLTTTVYLGDRYKPP